VELGYHPTDAELAECYRRVTAFADTAKHVRARDLMSIAHQVIHRKVVTSSTPSANATEASTSAA
jgi:hypothetical protein